MLFIFYFSAVGVLGHGGTPPRMRSTATDSRQRARALEAPARIAETPVIIEYVIHILFLCRRCARLRRHHPPA